MALLGVSCARVRTGRLGLIASASVVVVRPCGDARRELRTGSRRSRLMNVRKLVVFRPYDQNSECGDDHSSLRVAHGISADVVRWSLLLNVVESRRYSLMIVFGVSPGLQSSMFDNRRLKKKCGKETELSAESHRYIY